MIYKNREIPPDVVAEYGWRVIRDDRGMLKRASRLFPIVDNHVQFSARGRSPIIGVGGEPIASIPISEFLKVLQTVKEKQ